MDPKFHPDFVPHEHPRRQSSVDPLDEEIAVVDSSESLASNSGAPSPPLAQLPTRGERASESKLTQIRRPSVTFSPQLPRRAKTTTNIELQPQNDVRRSSSASSSIRLQSLPLPVTRKPVPAASQTPAQLAERRKSSTKSRSGDVDDIQENETWTEQKKVHSHGISTMDILHQFDTSNDPGEKTELQIARKTDAQNYQARRSHYRKILKDLKQRRRTEGQNPLLQLLSPIFPQYRRPKKPELAILQEITLDFFPPRTSQLIFITDFKADGVESWHETLGNIERTWTTKPDDVIVRWIHASVGKGISHSSIEDMFLHHGEHGRKFVHAGRAGFPFLDVDRLHLQKATEVQDRRLAYKYLSETEELFDILDKIKFEGDQNENFEKDLNWRAAFLRIGKTGKVDYWNTSGPDHVYQILEGSRMATEGPADGIRYKKEGLDQTSLEEHPEFEGAQLVLAPFRCFHRKDGCLLTMSAARGIDYINHDLLESLEEPPMALEIDPDVSVVGHVLERFRHDGMAKWHRRTVEWLAVYLVTEIGSTPHNIRHGRAGCSITNAYLKIVQNLKDQKYHEWVPKKSVEVVRAYLICIDELEALQKIYTHRLAFFEALRKDVQAMEEEDLLSAQPRPNPGGEKALHRVDWTLNLVREDLAEIKRLHADLRQAMDALFQLRSIEQNDLAITRENQDKAIFIFTVVTIIFLPLSFFTSYYGMNVSGIAGKSQSYFWEVSGPITVLIISIVALYAFRAPVQRILFRQEQGKPKGIKGMDIT